MFMTFYYNPPYFLQNQFFETVDMVSFCKSVQFNVISKCLCVIIYKL